MTALAVALALAAGACDRNAKSVAAESSAHSGSLSRENRVSVCSLMPKEDINAITGDSFTVAEPKDDGHSSSSSCHYSSPANPGYGVTLDLTWIDAHEYSSAAQHLALQHASIGGLQLGGKLAAGMAPTTMPGVHTGPIEGVGDEAYLATMTLSARKGDYTVMVQAMPDFTKLISDSTLGIASEAHEKAIANKLFSKL